VADLRASGVGVLRGVALVGSAVAIVATVLSPSAGELLFHHTVLGWHITTPEAYALCWLAGGALGLVVAVAVLRAQDAATPRTICGVLVWTAGVWIGARWHYLIDTQGLSASLSGLGSSPLDSGARLPLAFLCGAVAAALWCLLTRTPWRETGDALAAHAATLEVVGRTGCLIAGCCTGRVCPAWLSATCLRYPSGSKPFLEQLAAGVVDVASPMSAPLLPLPLYFALAAAGTLLLMAHLLRARARPGSMLTAFAIVWPIWKIGLELLRATPRPAGLMLGIPASVFLLAVAFALWPPRRAVPISYSRES